jgi:hypothetical protein
VGHQEIVDAPAGLAPSGEHDAGFVGPAGPGGRRLGGTHGQKRRSGVRQLGHDGGIGAAHGGDPLAAQRQAQQRQAGAVGHQPAVQVHVGPPVVTPGRGAVGGGQREAPVDADDHRHTTGRHAEGDRADALTTVQVHDVGPHVGEHVPQPLGPRHR